MFSKEGALAFLKSADLFFDKEDGAGENVINMNDVWGWGCADGENVEDSELQEVAEIFYQYGWPGILYWTSKKRGGMRSEFLDNNRFIDFVANEERIKHEVPDSNKRAYHKEKYVLGA